MAQLKQMFNVGDTVHVQGSAYTGVIVEVIISDTIAYSVYFEELNMTFGLNQCLLEKVDTNGTTSK